MTEYKPGQRLTLAHDDGTVLVGTVLSQYDVTTNEDEMWFDAQNLQRFRLDGILSRFRVTHIDGQPVPETPTLPTEPGAYQAERGRQVFLLNREGDWFDADGTPSFGHGNPPEDYGTLTRLMTLDEARPIIAREIEQFFRENPEPLASHIVRAIEQGPEVSE